MTRPDRTSLPLTSNHWGLARVETDGRRLTAVHADASDPDPSALNANMVDGLGGAARVLRPAVRSGWLAAREGRGADTAPRGSDTFVELPWDRVLDLLAGDLTRVCRDHGNGAIYAGSYGWASAGRFHHAQGQLKRFLNTIGGFVGSEGNYSYNAALVALPHIVGGSYRQHLIETTRWSVVAEHTGLVVAFGGLPMRNTQICDGGNSRHRLAGALARCAERGVRFVNLSPLRSDIDPSLSPDWLAPAPGTDVAVMLGLAHTLLTEGLCDHAFLASHTEGFDRFAAYLTGQTDGVAKDAGWAAHLSGLPADTLRQLARDMARHRTMISVAAGLQRADWGEQPLWAAVSLACMLGQIGLPGGGYTVGYAVNGHVGVIERPFRWGAFPQGENPVNRVIPVAMVADMLLHPGTGYAYDGGHHVLPEIKLVWWAGGNPFHHHQDLNRLVRAFQRPETVVVNELNWTATARHADIVLPVAAPSERRDFGAGKSDNILVPMPRLVPPPGAARCEYDIFADLAARMGVHQAFTQGRDTDGWLRHLWDETRATARAHGQDLPDWDRFMTAGLPVELPDPAPDQVFLSDFRADPKTHPRATPSGRIEIFSQVVANFGLPDCPGHAMFTPMRDRAAGLQDRYPLALISGQPATRLHSQLDNGALSRSHKIAGREPVLIHPRDAEPRGIEDGQIVELLNDRGRVLAGARLSEDVAPGCVFLWTGAWYDPDPADPHRRDRHGNPNVLTHDLRTSAFSQSPAAHSALVEIRPLTGPAPRIEAHDPPRFVPE